MASTAVRFAKSDTVTEETTAPVNGLKEARDKEVPAMFVWSVMKRLARVVSLERRARLVAAILPARYWFSAAILLSRWQAMVSSAFVKSRPGISQAYLREHWLVELSRIGPFPIPIQVSGAELLKPSDSDRAGVVLCGTHVPLLLVMLRGAILSGYKPDLVVADPDGIRLENKQFQPTGLSEGIPAVESGSNGLLRIRTVLRKKGLVACTLDREAGGETYPDLLILAGRLGARAVTFRAALAPDGIVYISFQNTLHPFCENSEAIKANLKVIREDERRVLASLDGLVDSNASISTLSHPEVLPNVPEKGVTQPPVIPRTANKAAQR